MMASASAEKDLVDAGAMSVRPTSGATLQFSACVSFPIVPIEF